MNIISIHQPNYIPWLGYFYKIFQSDIFVFLDDAQFSNEGMHNYHYIKTPQGSFRLKIPIKGNFGMKINLVASNDVLGWKEKHLKTLTANYKRSEYFEIIFSDFKSLLDNNYGNLALMNEAIVKFYCEKFSFKTDFIESSSLGIKTNNEEKIIDICKFLNGDVYYSGTGARKYQNEENFQNNGITLKYSEFKPFSYPQLWGKYQPNVTILDYLMNCGYDWARVVDNQKINHSKDADKNE
jgi:hypothetical protein